MTNARSTSDPGTEPIVTLDVQVGVQLAWYAVESSTESTPHGVLVFNDVPIQCTCLGFRYNWRTAGFRCRHMNVVNTWFRR